MVAEEDAIVVERLGAAGEVDQRVDVGQGADVGQDYAVFHGCLRGEFGFLQDAKVVLRRAQDERGERWQGGWSFDGLRMNGGEIAGGLVFRSGSGWSFDGLGVVLRLAQDERGRHGGGRISGDCCWADNR